jgi:hypothetical protein
VRLRTDTVFSETDPARWLLASETLVASWSAIIHDRERFPVTFPHELGHILGLSHPENTLSVDDDQTPSNVMLSTGAHKKNAAVADLFADSISMTAFETEHCERLVAYLEISPNQCLIAQQGIPTRQFPAR